MKAVTPLLLLGAALVLGAGPIRVPDVHEVSMRQEGDHYVFQPASLRIKQGDVVRFINISGGPHNVAFDSTGMPDAAKAKLEATMKEQLAPLAGPLIVNEKQSYDVAFDVPPGKYSFYCMPHTALGMKGIVTVE